MSIAIDERGGIYPVRPAEQASLQKRVLAVLFVISFALDFKGAAGGSPIQYGMASLNTIAFLLLAVSYRVAFPRSFFAALVLCGWTVFLLVGSIGAMISAVPFNHYIRIVYPFVLFLEGFWVAWWVSRDPRGAQSLVAAMMFAAMVSLIFTFWWGLHFSGESYANIRYQILSPLIPFLIVVGGYDLFFMKRRMLRSLVILVVTLGVIGISVTRGMLLVVGIVAAAVFLAWLWNIFRNFVTLPRPIARTLLGGIAAGIIGLLLALALYPGMIQRWVNRGLGVSNSGTFWTRVAGAVGEWDQLIAHYSSWLAGVGFGHSYTWSSAFEPLAPYISTSTFNAPKWFPTEFMWVTPLYYSGFLAGVAAIVILLWGAGRAFRILTVLLEGRTWRSPLARPVWVGVLGYFAFLSLGFTANPFILRLSALFLGLCLGLISNSCIVQSRAVRSNRTGRDVMDYKKLYRVKLISGVWSGLRKAASPAEIETV